MAVDDFHELVGVEGLGQVVDRAALAALLARFRAVEGGENDDDGNGSAGVSGLVPHPAADLEAIEVREHQVEDNEGGAALADLGQRVGAVEGGAGGEAGDLRVGADQLVDLPVVLDDQDLAFDFALAHFVDVSAGDTVLPRRGGADQSVAGPEEFESTQAATFRATRGLAFFTTGVTAGLA